MLEPHFYLLRLITGLAQAETELIAKDLADSRIHLRLALSEGNSAESLLNDGDLNPAAAAFSQATADVAFVRACQYPAKPGYRPPSPN